MYSCLIIGMYSWKIDFILIFLLLLEPGLGIDEFSRKKLDATAAELSEEKALAYSCLS